MNLSMPSNLRSESGQEPDPLDNLLRDFFRSEMPAPWPGPPRSITATRSVSWWTRSRSRLALAASVALLVVGSWWLAGRTRDYTAPTLVNVEHGSGSAASGFQQKIRGKVKEQEQPAQPPTSAPR